MQIELTERELELLHYCVNKETPNRPQAKEELELADLEGRLASILAESETYHKGN